MSSEDASGQKDAIETIIGITGLEENMARELLIACDWNVQLAVNMHVDTDDSSSRLQSSSSRSSRNDNHSAGPSNFNHQANNHNQDQQQNDSSIITVPDHDDSVVEINTHIKPDAPHRYRNFESRSGPRRFGQPPSTSSSSSASGIASSADAELAAALAGSSDSVRPPIPPIRQILVQQPIGYGSSDLISSRRYPARASASSDVYDAFRDFQAEAQWQETAQLEAESNSEDSESLAAQVSKRRTLQDLFRPPLDLMFRGSLQSAREAGTLKNKWLLVNVQNCREFACQALNRDVWSNQTVKDIVKEHFIFWQVYHDSAEGTKFVQFYHVTRFPHVSIIDPRTGEQMKSWPVSIDHNSFCDSVIEFLTEQPSPDGSADASSMKRLCVKDEDPSTVAGQSSSSVSNPASVKPTLYDQSEEAQLEAAIKASLQEAESSNSSSGGKAFRIDDEDSSFTDTIESDTDNNQNQQRNSSSAKSQSQRNPSSTAKTNGQQAGQASDSEPIGKPRANKVEQGRQEASQMEVEVEIEDYKKYLGVETEQLAEIQIRFPDGTRDKFKFPCDTKLKALFLLLTSKGYGLREYNYVTTYPRRLISTFPDNETLQEHNLARCQVIVERKLEND